RSQRDHSPVESEVLVPELGDVAHHRGFRVVAVEHRVGEERRGAPGFLRDADRFAAAARGETGGDLENLGADLLRREFVSGDLHRVRIRDVDVDAPLGEGTAQLFGPALDAEGDGVEEVRLEYGDAPFVR